MTVSGFGNSEMVPIITARSLFGCKSDIGSKMQGRGKTFEIANFRKHRQGGHSFDTNKTGQLPDIILISFNRYKLFNTLVESFQLIREKVISQEILMQNLSVQAFRL